MTLNFKFGLINGIRKYFNFINSRSLNFFIPNPLLKRLHRTIKKAQKIDFNFTGNMNRLNLTIKYLVVFFIFGNTLIACSSSDKAPVSSDVPKAVDTNKNEGTAPQTSPPQVEGTYKLDLSRAVSGASLKGFSVPEPAGSWTQEKTASITFEQSLPKDLTLVVNGIAFVPNINKDLTVKIGSQTQTFRLGKEYKNVSLKFNNVNPSDKTIVFVIPAPTSPKELGLSGDIRKLGISLKDVDIISAK